MSVEPMKQNMPVLFVSHGAPSMFIDRDPTTLFFKTIGQVIPTPKTILCVSAHWETEDLSVTGNLKPQTIYDFYGFPEELYELEYPCPGSPVMAESITQQFIKDGIDCVVNHDRGLDHGAWVPLKLMFPLANIPVVQLSIQRHKDPEYHYKLGQKLQSLRKEGVLIIASGGATHNLREFGLFPMDAAPPDYVLDFDNWLLEKITSADIDALLDYKNKAGSAIKNHPTEEHIMPLFVALGAAGNDVSGKQINQGYTYGVLSMAAYQW
jgi:4,5-DOPA dioxygenase extradiol